MIGDVHFSKLILLKKRIERTLRYYLFSSILEKNEFFLIIFCLK